MRQELRGDATGTKEVVAIDYLAGMGYFLCGRLAVEPVVSIHQEGGQKNNRREFAGYRFFQVIIGLLMDGGIRRLLD
jgi:hypothetical protein